MPTVHAIPGTNYAFINGDRSLDNTTQQRLINNIIKQLAPSHAASPPNNAPTSPSAFVTPDDDLNITGSIVF